MIHPSIYAYYWNQICTTVVLIVKEVLLLRQYTTSTTATATATATASATAATTAATTTTPSTTRTPARIYCVLSVNHWTTRLLLLLYKQPSIGPLSRPLSLLYRYIPSNPPQ